MDHVIYLFVVAVLLAAGLAGTVIWLPRPVLIKVVPISRAALMMQTAYASLVDLLGKPKPVSMEWVRVAVPEALCWPRRSAPIGTNASPPKM